MLRFRAIAYPLRPFHITCDHAGNAVGVGEGGYVVHVPLRVLSRLIESGAIQQGTGNSIVNVFLDDHVTRGRDLPLELARTVTAYTQARQALLKTLRNCRDSLKEPAHLLRRCLCV